MMRDVADVSRSWWHSLITHRADDWLGKPDFSVEMHPFMGWFARHISSFHGLLYVIFLAVLEELKSWWIHHPRPLGFCDEFHQSWKKLGLHGEYVCILETSVSSPACLCVFSFPVHWHHLLYYNSICAKLTWLSCDDDDDFHTFAVSTRETLVSEMAPILPWMSESHDIKRRKRVHVCWVNQYLTASLR